MNGDSIQARDQGLAYLVLRLALGVNLVVHGAGRFGEAYRPFVSRTVSQYYGTFLPLWSVSAFAGAVPAWEFTVGVLLILGLWTRLALLFGSLLMILLILGMSLLRKWDVVGIEMIYILFYFLLLHQRSRDRLSVDRYFADQRVE